jgi:hypothetical protein
MFFISFDKFSIKFLLELRRKKASFVALFSQIQGKYQIDCISLFSASGISLVFKVSPSSLGR